MNRRFTVFQLVTALIFGAGFAAGAHVLAGNLTDARNRQQIADLNQQMLRRAEMGIDYAFMALGSIAEKSALDCSAGLRAIMREQVFETATIKNVRVIDGSGKVLCSAFDEFNAPGARSVDVAASVPGRNTQVRLATLKNMYGPSLAVLWRIGDSRYLMAAVNTSAMLFDVLPAALRDTSTAAVSLAISGKGASMKVASYRPAGYSPRPEGVEVFRATSQRFPVHATIAVDRPALVQWNRGMSGLLETLACLLGLAFGFLFARVMFRPPDPLTLLDRALAAREFKPFFQPLFCLQTGRIVACEVLARWVKPDGTIIAPYQFIPLAEQSGRIVPMTWQLVDQALTDMRPWLKSHKQFRVAFNFGADMLLKPGFAEELRAHVSAARAGSRNVTIELTEREGLSDLAAAAGVIGQLRDHGYTIAIDDAGTGHSGLSHIQKLGADVIKIDKLFVDAVCSEHSARALIGMLVSLARELSMTTVAEGIETEEQAVALMELGVDKGQGYLVSPPVTAGKFLALLEADEALAGWRPVRTAA